MNSFGLGLILSFTDNASAGINNAVNSLQQLTGTAQQAGSSLNELASLGAFSMIASQMGGAMQSTGENIISTFTKVIGTVNETGMTLMQAENMLGKLYEGSSKTGKDVLNDISAYAKASIFDFEQLIPVVTMLKANGIEAFDEIASSTGNSRQTLMDYAADLAAFNPQMKNAYGTGIRAAMGALNEYISEGNAKSLKSGASLDITALLGEDKGATIEERSRQVADLLEQLNMVGMVASLAESPMTKLSNMEDTLFQFKGLVSSAGVFEHYTNIISIFADFVNNIPEERLESIANSVGSALASLMEPVEWLAAKLVELADAFLTFVENNPKLAKAVIQISAVSGVLLLLGGVALKVMGSLGYLSIMLKQFSGSFGTISAVMRTGVMHIIGTLLPLALAIATVYAAWKSDFAGIRTSLTTFVTGVRSSFNTAADAVNGSVVHMCAVLGRLDTTTFFGGLTLAIMRLMVLFRALAEGWNGFTLSDDTFQKAEQLGILPLIEAIFDLKYRFDHFVEGFKQGWTEISTVVKDFFNTLTSSVDGTIFESLFQGITNFFKAITNNDPAAWTAIGEAVGRFVAKAVLITPILLGVIGAGKKVFSLVSGITSVVKPLFGLIAANPVVAIIVGVVAALAILYAKSETFRNLVGQVIDKFRELGEYALNTFGPVLYEAFNALQGVLPSLIDAFGRIFEAVGPIVEQIGSLVIQLLPPLSQVIGSIITTVIQLLPTVIEVITTIANVIGMVLEIAGELFSLIVPFIVDVVDMLANLVSDLLPVLADLLSNVLGAVMNGVNLILPMLKRIFEALMPIVQTILDIAKMIISRLIPIVKSVVSIVSNVIKAVIDVIMPIITVVMQIVETIIQVLSPIVDTILEAVGFIIDVILGIVQVVMSAVNAIVAIIAGIVNVVMSIVNTIVQFIMMCVGVVTSVVQVIVDTITGIISGIVGIVQGVWDGIVGVFSGALDFFSGIFTSIFEIVSGVFNSIADFFTTVWDSIVTTFATLGDTISGAIKGAVNGVLGFAVNVINGFIKAINFAIGIINAIPGVSISKLTELSVPQLARGGVVTQPTTAIIGEAGAEAVMPLENNLGWIDVLASRITNSMSELTPVANQQNTATSVTNEGDTSASYMTNNQGAVNNDNSSYDHSVTFSEGAIVIQVMNASEEEAERLAKTIMERIKREQEIENMRNYQPVH